MTWFKRKKPQPTPMLIMKKLLEAQVGTGDVLKKVSAVLTTFDKRLELMEETFAQVSRDLAKVHERQDVLIRMFNNYAEQLNAYLIKDKKDNA